MGTNFETWQAVMNCKPADTRHLPGDVGNDLTVDEVETILATYDYFGADTSVLQQIAFDIAPPEFFGRSIPLPRYRVFDWLAMMVQGRGDNGTGWETGTKVMVHSFLKCGGDVDRFIDDLRCSDYECDTSWESVLLFAEEG